jgi:M6 family metalloprotease-like protein
MRRLHPAWVTALLSASLGVPLAAQDVELLGEVYGTRPPDGYFQELQRNPGAFRFDREGPERLRMLRDGPLPGAAGVALNEIPRTTGLGPRPGPVVGVFRFPLVLGLFSDEPSEPLYTLDELQTEFFDGPNSRYQTLSEFYAEMSGGLLEIEGVGFGWIQSGMTRLEVTQNQSALVSHPTMGIGGYVERLVQALDDAGVDWSRYDRSGDGFVDIFAVMHPFAGAECTGGGTNQVWSHRWSLRSATQGRLNPGFRTSTPRPDGNGFIHVNDYVVQPLLACDAERMNEIGVLAHELGHGLGLPDLYPTGSWTHAGVGSWDLMGTGSWGCQGSGAPARPCHMGAWTKSALGWLQVEEVQPGEDRIVTLEPVQYGNRVLKIPSREGAREYLLLENRQRISSDLHLFEPGLLIWHVDEALVEANWSSNTVNVNADHMGVWLRQADGQNHLASPGAGRGDPGDPFPGCIKPSILRSPPTLADYGDPSIPCGHNRSFRWDTQPAALTHAGRAMGVALTEIELIGPEPHDVRFRLDTRFSWDTVTVSASAEAARDLDLALTVAGLPGSLTWRLVGGSLPAGLTLDLATGRLQGLTFAIGDFEFAISAADGADREIHMLIALHVSPPDLSQQELVARFLRRTDPLTPNLRHFLDIQGNQNGGYDLGDLRAYLQANPDLPEEPGEASAFQAVLPLRNDPWVGEAP